MVSLVSSFTTTFRSSGRNSFVQRFSVGSLHLLVTVVMPV